MSTLPYHIIQMVYILYILLFGIGVINLSLFHCLTLLTITDYKQSIKYITQM
jgi:hypothetical protein